MKTDNKLFSVTLASVALILFLTLVSSVASATTEQGTSSAGTYAYITNCDSDTVSVIDTATDTVIATVPVGDSPQGVAITPNGTKIYVTNNYDYNVSVIDTATNTVTATVPVGSNPNGIAVKPDGTKVYVTGDGSNIYVIDTATNTVTATVPVGANAWYVAVTPDGKKVYVTNQGGQSVSVIDTATNTVTATVPVGLWPAGIAVSPDGKKVYVVIEGSNTVSVIDTATNKVTAAIKVGNVPIGVAVNPAGTKVYVTNHWGNTVSVIDASTNTVTATVPVGSNPLGVAVNPAGTKVYVANYGTLTYERGNTVSVIDTATNKVTATVPVGFNPSGVAVSPVSKSVLPVANFSAKPTSGKVPLTVAFTDTSTGTPTSWKWIFGDGKSSTVQNPVYTYSKAGNYTVSLTAKNAAGTNTKTIKNCITVKTASPKPVAAFSATPTSGNVPLKVKFTDKSTGTPTSWKWSFGDGNTSTVKTPAYTYSKAGNYTVSLTVKNAAGSSTKTITNYITVKTTIVKPVAAFSAAPTSGKAPLKVQFTDKSIGSPTSWKWSFGDSTYSASKSPAHKYSKAGKYTVSLTVKNAKGSNIKTMSNYITVKYK